MPVDISEYIGLAQDGQGSKVPTGAEPAKVQQQVVVSGGSVQSDAFADSTRFVRVHTDVAVRIKFGANPSADGSSMRMGPGSTEFFGVTPGHKMAVIQTT